MIVSRIATGKRKSTVSHTDCRRSWNGKRLNGQGRRFPWGDLGQALPRIVIRGMIHGHHRLGTCQPTAHRVVLACGQVREWTAPAQGRRRRFVVRGSSYMCSYSEGRPLWERDFVVAEESAPDLGFRLVLDCSQ